MSSCAISSTRRLEDLPPEVIHSILSHLRDDFRALIKLSATSQQLRVFSRDQQLWKNVSKERGIVVSARPRDDFRSTHMLKENWRRLSGTKFELPLSDHACEGHDDDVYKLVNSNDSLTVSGARSS